MSVLGEARRKALNSYRLLGEARRRLHNSYRFFKNMDKTSVPALLPNPSEMFQPD